MLWTELAVDTRRPIGQDCEMGCTYSVTLVTTFWRRRTLRGRPPLVTVVIPALNEQESIGDALTAVLTQDHPLDRLEVVVVDGGSTDHTVDVARSVLDGAALASWRVVTNSRGSTPSSLNVGLEVAAGELLCRVDARSFIPPDYVRRCVEALAWPDVAVAGGAQVARAAEGATLVARGIARALRNRYASGLSRYRRSSSAGPGDTVYLGAFRTAELREVGGWDERFLTNQDYELNQRMRRRGLIWADGGLPVIYRPRPTMRALAQQYRRFGRWKAAIWLESEVGIAPRQMGLLVAPLLAIYGILAFRPRARTLVIVGATALAAVDGAGREPGSVAERIAASAAMTVIGASWWSGTAEQAVRHVAGERLLASVPARAPAPPA